MKTADYILPEHWLSALINGDETGLNEDDQTALDAFYKDCLTWHGSFYCLGTVEDDSNGFMRYHDAQPYGIGSCDTWTVRFQVERE
jgi:hypothetical protein